MKLSRLLTTKIISVRKDALTGHLPTTLQNNVFHHALQCRMIHLLKIPRIFVCSNALSGHLVPLKTFIVWKTVGGRILLMKLLNYVLRSAPMDILLKTKRPYVSNNVAQTHMQIQLRSDAWHNALLSISFLSMMKNGAVSVHAQQDSTHKTLPESAKNFAPNLACTPTNWPDNA